MTHRDRLPADDALRLAQLREHGPELYRLSRHVRGSRPCSTRADQPAPQAVDPDVEHNTLMPLASSARHLRRDQVAVQAGMVLSQNSGPVEGDPPTRST